MGGAFSHARDLSQHMSQQSIAEMAHRAADEWGGIPSTFGPWSVETRTCAAKQIHSGDKCHGNAHELWPSPQSWNATDAPVTVWIAFEKVGSQQLLGAFGQRASYFHKPLRYTCGREAELIESPLCCEHCDVAPCACVHVPPGSVVQDNAYGLCELMPQRPCRYLVVLREPLARMVSSYNYYCASCADGNAFCPRDSLPCPNMTLLDFAHGMLRHPRADAFPPMYVTQLGLTSGQQFSNVAAVRDRERHDQLTMARARLSHGRMAVFTLETLGREAHLRRFVRHFEPSAADAIRCDWGRCFRGDVPPAYPNVVLPWYSSVRELSPRGNEPERSLNRQGTHRGSRAEMARIRHMSSLSEAERANLTRLLWPDVVLYRQVDRRAREEAAGDAEDRLR